MPRLIHSMWLDVGLGTLINKRPIGEEGEQRTLASASWHRAPGWQARACLRSRQEGGWRGRGPPPVISGKKSHGKRNR